MRLVVFIDGVRSTGQTYSVEEAAELIAAARRRGQRWDLRKATNALATAYRPLGGAEAASVVQSLTKALS